MKNQTIENITNAGFAATFLSFSILALSFGAAIIYTCFFCDVKPKESRHELLQSKDCYEHFVLDGKNRVAIKRTAECFDIAYPGE